MFPTKAEALKRTFWLSVTVEIKTHGINEIRKQIRYSDNFVLSPELISSRIANEISEQNRPLRKLIFSARKQLISHLRKYQEQITGGFASYCLVGITSRCPFSTKCRCSKSSISVGAKKWQYVRSIQTKVSITSVCAISALSYCIIYALMLGYRSVWTKRATRPKAVQYQHCSVSI